MEFSKNTQSGKMKRLGWRMLLSGCAMLLCMLSAANAAAENIKIYFYSSEASINNFKLLKMQFDSYLSRFGPYELQPFSDRTTFEEHIHDKGPCLLLLSSWHFSNLYREYALKPLLVGVKNGIKTHKHILVVKKEASSAESPAIEPVASAGSIQQTRSTLKELLPQKTSADALRILTVPKDMDALMSVGFGMSKAALATGNSYDELRLLNPTLADKMKILAEGKESLLLILAVPENFAKSVEKTAKVIRGMPADTEGKSSIKMLGLDDWQELDSADEVRLLH